MAFIWISIFLMAWKRSIWMTIHRFDFLSLRGVPARYHSDFILLFSLQSHEWRVLERPGRKNIVKYPCCSEPFPGEYVSKQGALHNFLSWSWKPAQQRARREHNKHFLDFFFVHTQIWHFHWNCDARSPSTTTFSFCHVFCSARSRSSSSGYHPKRRQKWFSVSRKRIEKKNEEKTFSCSKFLDALFRSRPCGLSLPLYVCNEVSSYTNDI